MSFTDVFGGSQVDPAQVSYLALTLAADTTLQWPLEALPDGTVVAGIIDVTPSGMSLSVIMPDARQASTGSSVLFNNVGGFTFTVKDPGGNTLLSVASGTQWVLYLRDNTTENGLWRSYQFGASVSQAQASALAGFGLTAIGSVLAQSEPTTLFSMDFTAGIADRASLYVWTGTGAGTLTLPVASDVGDGWYLSVRNQGGGNLTIQPQGSDDINDDTDLVLQPGDSATVATDGINFYTVGFGQEAIFAFDYTSIAVPGTGNYTLSGAELNRIAYKFTGILTGNRVIILPTTTQQYWIDNSTTGGSFTLSIKTASQTPAVEVPRGSRGIYYCNGSIIVKADTASIATPIAIADGGTGATSAGDALINLGGTSTGIAIFTAVNEAAVRAALGAASDGVNSDITELTGLTTPLSVPQGGTGAITLTGLIKGNGASAFTAATVGTDYAKPDTASTWTALQTFDGGAAVLAARFKNAKEVSTRSATAATGTINYNVLSQCILQYTTNAAANWTLNIRGDGTHSLDSLMSTGETLTIVFKVKQGSTPFYNNVVQVDGNAVTPLWQGGAPTAGNPSGYDVYAMAIEKTGSATFEVFASLTPFS